MNFYNVKSKNNKKASANSIKRTRLSRKMFTVTLISLLVISAPLTLFSSTVLAEPSISTLLTDLGFTDITPSSVETFPSGFYKVTLFAEYGEFNDINILSYYPVGTEAYQTIITGPEGVPIGSGGAIVNPPLVRTFEVDQQFGLSLFAPYRYFTETFKNPDEETHALVFENNASPNMYLICFEDEYDGLDNDFNDMVFGLTKILPPKIVSVVRSPTNPIPNELVSVTAQVNKGTYEIDSVTLRYQIDSSGWNNVPMNLESGSYIAEIPGQPINTQITYEVSSYDSNGFFAVSARYSYSTSDMPGFLPIAQIINSPTVAYTGEEINFDASTSYDVDGKIVSYLWNLGDGTLAPGVKVSHSYEEDGEYPITLSVVDNDDQVGTYVVKQVVKNRPPVADFIESASIVNQNDVISFDASASFDLDGNIVSYTWSFGDGSATTGITSTHSYKDTGFYIVTLTINDNDGATDDHKGAIYVMEILNNAPVASFELSSQSVLIGESIIFDASESYDTDGTIDAYSWDFGDGTTTTGAMADHTYNDEGVYTVSLIVTDDDGATDDKISSVTVTETGVVEPEPGDNQPEPIMNDPPVPLFTPAETASIGESIIFDASESYDTDGTIDAYSWDFGDGTVVTGVTADHAYTETGNYTITLTVTDNDGAESSVVANITINSETTVSLAVLSAIGLGITGLTAALLIFFFQRRKKKKRS